RLKDAVDQLADDSSQLAKRDQFQADFIQAMDDDINAPNGLTVIYQLMREINLYLEEDQVSKVVLQAYRDLYLELLGIFGVTFTEDKELLD
ncbi:cysteine--tRNA ligase, partial [Aerococcus urinae]|uniref:DALR domain-containing protein n=2 Tax=Aerococcus TaxID=1375 RepID=UPI0027B97529